jgi:histidinol-phosphate/aromatic aminotransferase/cobyric acid decarboxylase-like protein
MVWPGCAPGAAIAQPELLSRIKPYSSGALPITGMAAAIASLRVDDLVVTRRKIIADTRAVVFAFLERHGFSYVPSVSNKFMVDVGQPGERVIIALRQEKVYIGRVWPSWPTHVRVSIGTPQEMEKFQAAFLKVMA